MGNDHIPTNLRDLVISKWQEGNQTCSKIAKDLLMNRNTVKSIIRRYKKTGSVENAEKSGRPRKTHPRIDRKIVRETKKDPFVSAK